MLPVSRLQRLRAPLHETCHSSLLQAIQSGAFEKVGHLRGGIYAWFRQSLPLEGSYDGSYAGRTPSVVEEKEFSYGRPPTLLETEDNLGGKTPR